MGGAGLSQPRRRRRPEPLGSYAQQAAPIAAAVEVEVLDDVSGDGAVLLDHLAIHADHVEASIVTVVEVYGTKPDVRRGEKLSLARQSRPGDLDADAIPLQHQSHDDVVRRLTDETVAAILLGKSRTTIDGETRGSSHPTTRGELSFGEAGRDHVR